MNKVNQRVMASRYSFPFPLQAGYVVLLACCLVFLANPLEAQTSSSGAVNVWMSKFAENEEQFFFEISLTNSQRVRLLRVELWLQGRTVLTIQEKEFPGPIVIGAFPKTGLVTGQYEVVVTAVDHNGYAIALPSDRLDEAPDPILLRYLFPYELPDLEPIAFTIRAIIPNSDSGILRIEMGGINQKAASRVQMVEGFIFDSNKQVIGNFRQERLERLSLDVALPAQMAPGPVAQKFTVDMQISTGDSMSSEIETFEITIPPAEKLTWLERLRGQWTKLEAGIRQEPLLAIGILIVLLNTMGWLLIKGGNRKKKRTIPVPPVIHTGIVVPPDKFPGTPKIQVVVNNKPKTYKSSSITIGSDRGNDLRITDDTHVSRIHAEVRVEGKKLLIKDRGSKNGTYVDDQEILEGKWVEIGSNETVRLGPKTKIQLKIQS